MTDQERNLITIQQLISQIIELIPTHLQPPKTVDAIVSEFKEESLLDAKAITTTVLAMLDLLGILTTYKGTFRTSNQVPTYFLRSLTWYLKHNVKIFENWTRTGGVNTAISINSLLEAPPHFLKIMELRRLGIAKEQQIQVLPSREQNVVFVLVKGRIGKRDYYLHEWDRRAEQFQLIGGRVEPGEILIAAARRELVEELDINRGQRLVYEQDFSIDLLNEPEHPIYWTGISPTYGALTKYAFWFCSSQFKVKKLILNENNLWISFDEMLNGKTKRGKKIGDPQVYKLIDAQIPGGLKSVPISINIKKSHNYLDYLDVKPRFFGVSFDIKKIFGDFFGSKM